MGERLHHTIKRDRRGHMFTLYINSLTTAKFLYLEFSCANTLLFNYYLFIIIRQCHLFIFLIYYWHWHIINYYLIIGPSFNKIIWIIKMGHILIIRRYYPPSLINIDGALITSYFIIYKWALSLILIW